MPTEAQIAANRLNAQKSTGPKTIQGKAVVAQNALKHGLFSTLVVVNGETQEDFDMFRDQMLAELLPVGIIESVLAERIISLTWRLRRAEVMQSQSIDVMIAQIETSNWEKGLRQEASRARDPRAGGLEMLLGWATIKDLSNSRVIERLLIYERRIEHSIFKVMAELERLQQIRENEKTAAEAEQAIPIPKNDDRDEAATRTQEDKTSNYEKQSQSPGGLKNVKPYSPNDYGNHPSPERGANKPNSKPISPSDRDKRPALPGRRDRLAGASVSVRQY